METKWLDREQIDRDIPSVPFAELNFDQDIGVYCHQGEPFTGVCSQRYPDGKLQSIIHNVLGTSSGVTAAWYPNGQIMLYSEMHADELHGMYIEWAKDGTKTTEQRYRRGNLITE
ncbi:MAG: hypothetical protein HYX68_14485 [Planctomycetes bacterium]|nr:hypothetical protein [Planctomycetota bacterium]